MKPSSAGGLQERVELDWPKMRTSKEVSCDGDHQFFLYKYCCTHPQQVRTPPVLSHPESCSSVVLVQSGLLAHWSSKRALSCKACLEGQWMWTLVMMFKHRKRAHSAMLIILASCDIEIHIWNMADISVT